MTKEKDPYASHGEFELLVDHLEKRIERDAHECQLFLDVLNDQFLKQQKTGHVLATKVLTAAIKKFVQYNTDVHVMSHRLIESLEFVIQMKKEEYDDASAVAVAEILKHKDKLPQSWFENDGSKT